MSDLITIAIMLPIVVLVVLPLVLGAYSGLNVAVSERLAWMGMLALDRNRPGCALVAAWFLSRMCAGPEACVFAVYLRALAAADGGRTKRAVRAVETMVSTMRAVDPDWCPWQFLNTAIDIYVNAGLYRRAVALADQWTEDARENARQADPASYAVAQINRAEALHNLGDDAGALALLESVDEDCRGVDIAVHGRALFRAWILALAGKRDEAQSHLDLVDPRALGARYRAEFHYTESLLARERRDLDEAVLEGREGLGHARRSSSRRNGLIMVAAAELARGNLSPALDLLTAARRHRYQGQAAAGLLLLGQAYERGGRPADAMIAYADAIQLDPESFLVEEARRRVRALDAK